MKKFFSVIIFFLIIFISVLFSELFLIILEKRSYSNKFFGYQSRTSGINNPVNLHRIRA